MLRSMLAPLFVLVVSCVAIRAETSSGDRLKPGDALREFVVTKIAGAEDDPVEPGESLCYRCRYGSSPMALVFSRSADKNVQRLSNKLSALIASEESETGFKGLVALLGGDRSKLESSCQELAKAIDEPNLPLVIPAQNVDGPALYKLPPDNELTVVLGVDSRVAAVYSYEDTDALDIKKLTKQIRDKLLVE